MISSVRAGDKIVTRGGIFGTIFSLNEDTMVIVTGPDSVKLEMSKMSISSVLESKQYSETEKTEEIEETNELPEAEENSEEKTE
jgi:preprotein translocase subunit YajC